MVFKQIGYPGHYSMSQEEKKKSIGGTREREEGSTTDIILQSFSKNKNSTLAMLKISPF